MTLAQWPQIARLRHINLHFRPSNIHGFSQSSNLRSRPYRANVNLHNMPYRLHTRGCPRLRQPMRLTTRTGCPSVTRSSHRTTTGIVTAIRTGTTARTRTITEIATPMDVAIRTPSTCTLRVPQAHPILRDSGRHDDSVVRLRTMFTDPTMTRRFLTSRTTSRTRHLGVHTHSHTNGNGNGNGTLSMVLYPFEAIETLLVTHVWCELGFCASASTQSPSTYKCSQGCVLARLLHLSPPYLCYWHIVLAFGCSASALMERASGNVLAWPLVETYMYFCNLTASYESSQQRPHPMPTLSTTPHYTVMADNPSNQSSGFASNTHTLRQRFPQHFAILSWQTTCRI